MFSVTALEIHTIEGRIISSALTGLNFGFNSTDNLTGRTMPYPYPRAPISTVIGVVVASTIAHQHEIVCGGVISSPALLWLYLKVGSVESIKTILTSCPLANVSYRAANFTTVAALQTYPVETGVVSTTSFFVHFQTELDCVPAIRACRITICPISPRASEADCRATGINNN